MTGTQFRPELSDTLPWYRAVQGGVYHCEGYCWGFILDADCGDRSYMDDEVIITRAYVISLTPSKSKSTDKSVVVVVSRMPTEILFSRKTKITSMLH